MSSERVRDDRDGVHRLREFVKYLEWRVGDYLRTVVRYSKKSTEILYRRDDLAHTSAASQRYLMARRSGAFAIDESVLSAVHRCTVLVFDSLLLLEYDVAPDENLIVTLEPEAGRDLHRFAKNSNERLQGTWNVDSVSRDFDPEDGSSV